MKTSAKVQGVQKLTHRFQSMRSIGTSGQVDVSFTAPYAIYVHENKEMKLAGKPRPSGLGNYWDPAGKAQPGFLRKAVARLRPGLGALVKGQIKQGRSLFQALNLFALQVLNAARDMVPVETGELKASGTIKVKRQ